MEPHARAQKRLNDLESMLEGILSLEKTLLRQQCFIPGKARASSADAATQSAPVEGGQPGKTAHTEFQDLIQELDAVEVRCATGAQQAQHKDRRSCAETCPGAPPRALQEVKRSGMQAQKIVVPQGVAEEFNEPSSSTRALWPPQGQESESQATSMADTESPATSTAAPQSPPSSDSTAVPESFRRHLAFPQSPAHWTTVIADLAPPPGGWAASTRPGAPPATPPVVGVEFDHKKNPAPCAAPVSGSPSKVRLSVGKTPVGRTLFAESPGTCGNNESLGQDVFDGGLAISRARELQGQTQAAWASLPEALGTKLKWYAWSVIWHVACSRCGARSEGSEREQRLQEARDHEICGSAHLEALAALGASQDFLQRVGLQAELAGQAAASAISTGAPLAARNVRVLAPPRGLEPERWSCMAASICLAAQAVAKAMPDARGRVARAKSEEIQGLQGDFERVWQYAVCGDASAPLAKSSSE